jgi:hypothetical protein
MDCAAKKEPEKELPLDVAIPGERTHTEVRAGARYVHVASPWTAAMRFAMKIQHTNVTPWKPGRGMATKHSIAPMGYSYKKHSTVRAGQQIR